MSKDKLAQAIAEQAGVSTEEVVAQTEEVQGDKLKAMLEAAGTQAEAVSEVKGETENKSRNKGARRNDATTRSIHVMISEELKQAVIMTHISYNTLTPEARIEKFRKATAKQKRVEQINAATDLTFETVEVDIPLSELDERKIALHEQYVEAGYKVVSNKPRPPKA